ncbi:MAG: metalloregulator ArsR/SmtB family transcription factor [Lentisphaeria bacterium]
MTSNEHGSKGNTVNQQTIPDYQMGSDRQVRILKALADPTRLRILRLLYHEELNVFELCQVLDLPQPSISRHLGALRNAQLVHVRKEGTKAYYTMREPESDRELFRPYLEQLGHSEHPDLKRLEESLYQRQRAVEDFAEEKAAQWDNIGKLLHNTYASLLALASMAPRGLTVADLGTGTGLLLPFLSALADRVYAVDQSAAMLRRARTRCRQTGLENVTFLHSSAEELADQLPPCDALLLHFVLHQVARPLALLENLRRHLETRGRIVIVDRVKHEDESAKDTFGSLWLGFNQEQINDWLEEAGYKTVFWQTFQGTDPESEASFPIFVAAAETCDRSKA